MQECVTLRRPHAREQQAPSATGRSGFEVLHAREGTHSVCSCARQGFTDQKATSVVGRFLREAQACFACVTRRNLVR
jgi:hypothetical protein